MRDTLKILEKSYWQAKIEAKPRYDQSTFLGRLKHFLRVTDPRTLLVDDDTLEKSKKMVADYNATRKIPEEGVDALWEAQNSTRIICHHFGPFQTF